MLKGQPKRDDSITVKFWKATQSQVYPIRDAIPAVNHASCPTLSPSGPRHFWGRSTLTNSTPTVASGRLCLPRLIVARPSHRLPQEVGGAPSGIGAALPEPGHQHVAGAGSDGQQRVIAPLAGVAPG